MCYVKLKAWKLIYLSGQMVGSAAEVARFGVTMIVFRFSKRQLSCLCSWQVINLVFKQCSFYEYTFLHHIQILGQKMDLKASTRRGKLAKNPISFSRLSLLDNV